IPLGSFVLRLASVRIHWLHLLVRPNPGPTRSHVIGLFLEHLYLSRIVVGIPAIAQDGYKENAKNLFPYVHMLIIAKRNEKSMFSFNQNCLSFLSYFLFRLPSGLRSLRFAFRYDRASCSKCFLSLS